MKSKPIAIAIVFSTISMTTEAIARLLLSGFVTVHLRLSRKCSPLTRDNDAWLWCERSTSSRTTLSGHGWSRFAALSPAIAIKPRCQGAKVRPQQTVQAQLLGYRPRWAGHGFSTRCHGDLRWMAGGLDELPPRIFCSRATNCLWNRIYSPHPIVVQNL